MSCNYNVTTYPMKIVTTYPKGVIIPVHQKPMHPKNQTQGSNNSIKINYRYTSFSYFVNFQL